MSFRRIRRRRSLGVPVTAGMPFTDATDSPSLDLLDTGAFQFFDATEGAPGPSVHRSNLERLRLLDSSLPFGSRVVQSFEQLEKTGRKSVKVGLSPASARTYPQRFFAVGKSVRKLGLSRRSWKQFNVVRVRVPERERFCVARGVRKQVLFARGVAGRNRRFSPGRGGTYHRNAWSSWRC